jgi:hypothetical protein
VQYEVGPERHMETIAKKHPKRPRGTKRRKACMPSSTSTI